MKRAIKKKPSPRRKVRAVRAPARRIATRAAKAASNGHPRTSPARAASAPPPFSMIDDDGRPVAAARAIDAIPSEVLLRIYRAMVLLRGLDARMLLMQRQGRIGFWGPTTGQEAATIASCAAFEDRDWILPALREAGCAVYRGFPLKDMVAQCIGNSADRVKGRQMPCHYSFKEGHYVAMSSVIGTQIPHAAGVAMAARIKKDKVVVAGYLGDGATSSSDFHVALNFAAVAKAPVVFICQNNQWAISVPFSKQTATKTVAEKARAYGIEGVRVDGNDALAVYAATKRAVDKARAGGGPTFLELVTYRMLGHSSSDDPTRYRDENETKAWAKKEPIARLRKFLERKRLWGAAREEKLEGEIAATIADAVRVAEAAPPVDPKTIVEDVYRVTPPHLKEEVERTLADLAD